MELVDVGLLHEEKMALERKFLEKESEGEEWKRKYQRAEEEIERLKNQSIQIVKVTEKPPSLPSSKEKREAEANSEVTLQLNRAMEEFASFLKEEDPLQVKVEDAQKFILAIQKQRNSLTEMRDSICGSLKHLGADLYSSPTHFLHEIIQNAEDNIYSDVVPHILIDLHPDYILISNNERGFRPKDVKSLCSLAVTTKSQGNFIGQKGLGFKSVFSCTENPHILSGPWRFAFQLPGRDEMSYITPHWISEESMPSVELRDQHTHFYLPLKKSLLETDFLERVKKAADPLVMLNLTKVKRMRIRESDTSHLDIYCSQSDPDFFKESVSFSNITFLSVKSQTAVLTVAGEKGTIQKSFKMFECQVQVPQSVMEEEPSRSNPLTRISIAFPLEMDDIRSFPVYAALPVSDIGFPFLLNCDWVLVTSRESVRENPWNSFLRDTAATFLFYTVLEDQFVHDHMGMFLPKITSEMSTWWQRFVDIVATETRKHLGSSSKKYLLPNEAITKLVPSELIRKYAKVEVIPFSPDQLNTLKEYGIPQLSIAEVLECFSDLSNPSDERKEFDLWAQNKDSDWWKAFFLQLVFESSKLLSKAKTKPIFLLRLFKTPNGVSSNISRGFLSPQSKQFTCEDSTVNMWRNQLEILEYQSPEEKKIIKLFTEELTPKTLMEYLQLLHLENPNSLGSPFQIWEDLRYIRDHFQIFQEVQMTPTVLSVPCNKGLSCVTSSLLPSLLGLPISTHSPLSISFPYEENESLPLDQVVLWEHFFTSLKCQPPLPQGNQSFQLPLLTQLSPQTASLVEFVLQQQTPSTVYFLQSSLIQTLNGELVPVNSCCDVAVFRSVLPSITVPPHCREIADILQISLEADFLLCLKALQILVSQRVEKVEEYVQWLLKISLLDHLEEMEKESLVSTKLLYLPEGPSSSSSRFFSLNEIYCPPSRDHHEAIESICTHLKKNVISLSCNSIYVPFRNLLIKLGCSVWPSLEDASEALNLMTNNKQYFNSVGTGDLLNSFGIPTFNLMYEFIDVLLQHYSREEKQRGNNLPLPYNPGQIEDNSYRFSLATKSFPSLPAIPLVSSDMSLIHSVELKNVRACLQGSLIEDCGRGGVHFLFPDPSIVRKCPHLIAALHISYLETQTVLEWKRGVSNPEHYLSSTSKAFQTALEDPSIVVLSGTYPFLALYYSEVDVVRKDNVKSALSVSSGYSPPFLCFGNIVVCYTEFAQKERDAIFLTALSSLLQFKKKLPFDEALSKARNSLEGIDDRSLLWNEEETVLYFNTDEVIFPPAEMLRETNLMGNVETEKFPVDTIASSKVKEDEILAKRAEEISPHSNEDSKSKFDYKVVDQTELKKLGDRAEHFFCKYLQLKYQETFSPTLHWKSSSRLVVYPQATHGVNDACGYDFEVEDSINLFTRPDKKPKKCFIEVKGTVGDWDKTLHISSNETSRFEQTLANADTEAYIVAVVAHVEDLDRIALAQIINWTKDKEALTLFPESFKAKWTPPHVRNQQKQEKNENNNNNADEGEGGRRMYSPSFRGRGRGRGRGNDYVPRGTFFARGRGDDSGARGRFRQGIQFVREGEKHTEEENREGQVRKENKEREEKIERGGKQNEAENRGRGGRMRPEASEERGGKEENEREEQEREERGRGGGRGWKPKRGRGRGKEERGRDRIKN